MKKLVLCTITLLLMFAIAGCTKEDLKITAEEITADTLVAKSNGVLQVATVEDFDKDYYNLKELEEFIAQQTDAFNAKAGDKKVTVDEVLQRENKAIMILTYSGMDAYSEFNETAAAYFTGGVSDVPLELPTTLVTSKNDSLASTEEVIKNTKYKILVLNEPYKVIVDGSVKYYSENSELVDDNTIQGAEDGMTVVVFK